MRKISVSEYNKGKMEGFRSARSSSLLTRSWRKGHSSSESCPHVTDRRVRDAYCHLVEQGWTDALRALHPGERIYTFWKYFRNAFARDAGLRIDHLLLSPAIAGRLVAAGVDRDVRAREKSSDQAPVLIELA